MAIFSDPSPLTLLEVKMALYFAPGPSQTNRMKSPGPVQAVSMSIMMFKMQNQIKPVNTTTQEEKAKRLI